jgi:PAS domain S-box-containing protein
MQRLQALLESAPLGIVSSDTSDRIIAWNPAAQRIFGYPPEQALGISIDSLLSEQSRSSYRSHRSSLLEAAECGARASSQFAAVRRGGIEFPVEIVLSTWELQGQRFCTHIVRDLSDRAALELQLESLFATVANLLAGNVLDGRYALERLIRTDQLGSLYEAIDLEQRAPVMVRIVRTCCSPGASSPVADSDAPHTAEVLDVGVTEFGNAYAVTAPLPGESP